MNPRSSTVASALQLSLRAAVAAGGAVAIARLLNFRSPLFALMAAVIVMDLSPASTRRQALHRLVGTLVGGVVGAVFTLILPQSPWAVAAGILTAMLLGYAIGLRGMAAKLTGFVCGIIVLTRGDDAWTYAVSRTIETLLGIGMAVLVSFVPKLLRVEVPDETDA